MKDRLPHEHHVFAAALPDLREHFEQAAKDAADYAFLYDSIAHDLRQAERAFNDHGLDHSRRHIDTARHSMIAIYEERDFGAVTGDLEAAVQIVVGHKRKLGL